MSTVESDQPQGTTFENEAYVAPPEVMERAARAREELEAKGLEVRPVAHWWGYELILNQEAVDAYLDIKDAIADVLGEILKEPLSSLVAVAAMAQKLWVQAVSRGYGCKLVSPWISPLMLIPVGLGPKEDLNLWWTVFEPAHGWNKDERFTDHQSGANPALAVYNGRLVCVHRGANDNFLWYTEFDPAKGWTRDTRMGGQRSSDGASLAVFNNKLYCFYKAHNDTFLWSTSFDGTNWSAGHRYPAHESSRGPAVAVYDGKLHLVHRGRSDNSVWHSVYNGSAWTPDRQIPNCETAANPALAVWDGKLNLVHRGSSNDHLWHITYTTSAGWSRDHQLPGHRSLEGPALTVFNNELYCIHRGNGSGDQNLYWTKLRSGAAWTRDAQLPDHLSGAGPAAVVYRDPKNGTKDQLMVVHRGWGSRAAGSDAAEVEALLAAEHTTTSTTPDTP
ncbi:hypothetical protein [Streptomyces sp. NPDC053813]|uniref:hypothetical protein n=1 Tax=Streptomyces sp. NPDC053813 TaxID=3365717 RepID=UPI0037D4AF50